MFTEVMTNNDLDALVLPQMLSETPLLRGGGPIQASTVSEINMLGPLRDYGARWIFRQRQPPSA